MTDQANWFQTAGAALRAVEWGAAPRGGGAAGWSAVGGGSEARWRFRWRIGWRYGRRFRRRRGVFGWGREGASFRV